MLSTIKAYIKGSGELMVNLKALVILPEKTFLFTADATSMYTNIDTKHTLLVIGAWLNSFDLPDSFALEAVKEEMSFIMQNNIFEWEDLYFLQLLGTAMRISRTCMWATIYFAVHEMGSHLPCFDRHMPLFLGFIDAIIVIWVEEP
jgi:hypothetical protein